MPAGRDATGLRNSAKRLGGGTERAPPSAIRYAVAPPSTGNATPVM